MPRGKLVSSEERVRIIKLHDQGLNNIEIKARIPRSLKTIQTVVQAEKLRRSQDENSQHRQN